ncbi:hypothetical protein P7K49_032787 [Saguinus oedipus]|uniref:POLO box domain-containing protein n=1 Tax=Saguinus oedipus TaxID=9490 RepID=A0ABQ9TQS2_SAGOE|nr:hypothetical protein P7K49_032787 [Saguinus oedipus]
MSRLLESTTEAPKPLPSRHHGKGGLIRAFSERLPCLTLTPGPVYLRLCPATQDPLGEQQPILWASKWVDYSSKYGFGYQLSDGGSGVLLRDGTHMALRPPGGVFVVGVTRGPAGRGRAHQAVSGTEVGRTEDTLGPYWHAPSTWISCRSRGCIGIDSGDALCPGPSQVCYMPARGRLETFTLRDVPGPLGAKLAVLQLFARCLQRRLREEGTLPTPVSPAGPGLCLLRFLASEQALLLLLSNGTVQVSFSGVPAQLLLSGEGEGLQLTLWEQGPPGTSSSLDVLQNHGCAPATRQRLQHALRMLQSI